MIKIVEELWGTFEELWGTLHIASGNWKNKRNMIPQSSSFLDQVSDSGTQETLRNLPQELEELWGTWLRNSRTLTQELWETCLRNSMNSEEPASGTRGTLRNLTQELEELWGTEYLLVFVNFHPLYGKFLKVPQSSSEVPLRNFWEFQIFRIIILKKAYMSKIEPLIIVFFFWSFQISYVVPLKWDFSDFLWGAKNTPIFFRLRRAI